MSAPTITTDPDVDDPVEAKKAAKEAAKQLRDEAVQARTAELLDARTKAEMKAQNKRAKAASKRGEKVDLLDEKQMRSSLTRECEKQAKREVKAQERKKRRAERWEATKVVVSTDVASAVHRNRAQLPPAVAFIVYVLAAVVAVAFAVNAPSQLGTSALAGGLVSVVTWWAWTRGFGKKRPALRDRVPEAHRSRARTALAIWTACIPAAGLIAPSNHLGTIALIAVATLLWAAVPWWKTVEHPIPDKNADNEESPAPQPAAEPDQLDVDQKRIMGVLNRWNGDGGVSTDIIAESALVWYSSTDSVDTYRIDLSDRGRVVAKQIDTKLDDIALRLRVMADALSIEPDTSDPAVAWMRHVHAAPSFAYTGPRVYANGRLVESRWDIPRNADITFAVGHYVDGTGDACYVFRTRGGTQHGFVLGSSGSGKSVTLDVLGVAFKFLGCQITYCDGQDGASSEALAENVTFYGSSDAEAAQLWAEIRGFMDARNKQLREDKSLHGKYPYDPERPPHVWLIEEAHNITQKKFPGDEFETYGQALGKAARELRKLGGVIVLASQDYDLPTHGGSEPLRDALQTNLITLKYGARTRGGMLPPETPNLGSLPPGGYGYLPSSERPAAMWRGPSLVYDEDNLPNYDAGEMWPSEWLQSYEEPTLDSATARAMDTAVSQYASDALFAAATNTNDTVDISDALPAPVVVPLFGDTVDGPTDTDVQAAAVLDVEPISDSERVLLDALGWDGRARSATTVGENLGITRQAAQKRLEAASEKGLVGRLENRKWINRKKEGTTL